MTRESLLTGKRILIVDDEPDVLETLVALLPMCKVTTASSFAEAERLMENQPFDMAILDVMGVNGYELLAIAGKKKLTAVILTAHALSPEDLARSRRGGAASYLPKDKLADITIYLTDVLEAQQEGKSPWYRWLERLGTYFDKEFGTDWRIGEK